MCDNYFTSSILSLFIISNQKFEYNKNPYNFAFPFSGSPSEGKVFFDLLRSGGYQSGQLGRTVNPLTYVFEGSNPSPPTASSETLGVGGP